MEDNFLLTFELSEQKDELYIHSDLNGLRNLIDELNKLLKSAEKGGNDHTHLMSEEWGGYELSSDSQGGEILNHVKIYCWNDR
jgi:hypothetical protein